MMEVNTSEAIESAPADRNNDSIIQSTSSATTVETVIKKPEWLTLGLPVLLLFFSWNLCGTVFQNQVLFQTCTSYFNYNQSLCYELTDSLADDSDLQAIEEQVEAYAAKIFMSRAILENIVPAFISLFVGPWSDKYGRKPILLSTFTGYFCVYFMIAVISLIAIKFNISPWYYLIAFIPISILGGTCSLITGIYCYLSDISQQKDRAFRMARMEAFVFIGLLLGSLTSIYLYKTTSASFVFVCAATSTFIALIYLYFFVEESLMEISSEETTAINKFKALFKYEHVIDMFHTCFKKREHWNRAVIWLTIISLSFTIFVMEGSITLTYLFVREKFGWTIDYYNIYAATNIIVQIVGNVIGIYILSKMFGVSEIYIAILAFCSSMIEYAIDGLAEYSWQLYFATFITLLKGVASPMCRSILASIVPASEIGRIYAITTSIESLSPIGSAPLYTLIYTYTINSYPGAYNLFSGLIYLGCLIMMMIVCLIQQKQQNISYGPID